MSRHANIEKADETLDQGLGVLSTVTNVFNNIIDIFTAFISTLTSLGLSETVSYMVIGVLLLVAFFFLLRFLFIITKLLIVGLIILIVLGLLGVLF